MNPPFEIAVLVGSLRKASLTRKMAGALIDVAPQDLRCRVIEIGDLPMYNEDLDESPPAAWTRFRGQIAAAHAVLILTPEYNRSVPGCLKNALDVASRPSGKNLWDGKPAGIVSVTPYKLGAFGANHAVRQALVFLNMPAMQQPEAYIGGAGDLFDAKGSLGNDEVRQLLTQFMSSFLQWVKRLVTQVSNGPFDAFMTRRNQIAAAYSNGDATSLDEIVTRAGKATFFPPKGGCVSGPKEVAARYDADATSFSSGNSTQLEILDAGASGELAFWTGFQDFKGTIAGRDVKMKLRITEVFRLSGGEWKLVHRHADPSSAPEPGKS
jgi:NAD(P)H-dependent FMN reductase/ketosteroid isomerase-like protein